MGGLRVYIPRRATALLQFHLYIHRTPTMRCTILFVLAISIYGIAATPSMHEESASKEAAGKDTVAPRASKEAAGKERQMKSKMSEESASKEAAGKERQMKSSRRSSLVQFDDAFQQTKEMLMQMKAEGKSNNACLQLADATENEVKANMKIEQLLLEKMDKGENCPTLGVDNVGSALTNLKAAKAASRAAAAALAAADNAELDFGKFAFSSLSEGNCGTFYNSQVYQSAKAKVNSAKASKSKADGAETEAKKAHDNAIAAQKKEQNKCFCAVKKTHEAAVKTMNAKVDKANKDAWTKAAHIRCVLKGTPIDKCTVSALPQVKAVKLTTATKAATCNTGLVVQAVAYYQNTAYAVEYKGGSTTLTWDIQHTTCKNAGRKTAGSSTYQNKYCAYNANAWVVSGTCNWGNDAFHWVSGELPQGTKGMMCAHLNCDHVVRIVGSGQSYSNKYSQYTGKQTINTGDSVFCGPPPK